jgi:hypothetical protein
MQLGRWAVLAVLGIAAAEVLIMISPFAGLPNDSMGIDPDTTVEPVQLVFSRAEKAYKKNLSLEEAFDPGVRVKPFLVVDVIPGTGEVTQVLRPLPQNAWGANVVMPAL